MLAQDGRRLGIEVLTYRPPNDEPLSVSLVTVDTSDPNCNVRAVLGIREESVA
jgi:hypothetical protein